MQILAHTTIPLHKEAVWRPLQVRKRNATVFWEGDFLKCVLALDFGWQKIAICLDSTTQ